MGKENRFSSEMKERVVRLVYEQQKESGLSQWAIICSVTTKIGCSAETLRHWIRKDEIDTRKRDDRTTSDREHMKQLKKKSRDEKVQRNTPVGFCIFRDKRRSVVPEPRPPTAVTVELIDICRQDQGFESMCEKLQIAPPTYYAFKAKQKDPA